VAPSQGNRASLNQSHKAWQIGKVLVPRGGIEPPTP
jgi:hypothetical protein